MGRHLITAVSAALLITGCGTSTTPLPSAGPTTAVSIPPSERVYNSGQELADDLTAHGFRCDLPSDSGRGGGVCTLPSKSTTGIEADLSVWPTKEQASAGRNAMISWYETHPDDMGRKMYLVSGSNWVIDMKHNGVAAGQIVSTFGGRLTPIG